MFPRTKLYRIVIVLYYKEVLLRERKRHTDCGISITPSDTRGRVPTPAAGVPSQPGLMGVPEVGTHPPVGVLPQPGLMGGTRGGVSPQQGYPQPGLMRGNQGGVPPPWLDLAGVPGPPPPAGVDWQTKWNYNLPSRTT